MCVCAVVLCCVIITFIECSSIITKSMIRMPENSSDSSDPTISKILLPMVSSNMTQYEMLYPFRADEASRGIGKMRSLDALDEKDSNKNPNSKFTHSKDAYANIRNYGIVYPEHYTSKENTMEILNNQEKEANRSDGKVNIPNSNNSSKELSTKYWRQYTNFSNEFFDNSKMLEEASQYSKESKSYQDLDVWGMLRRLYSCVWSGGLFSCLQERLGEMVESDSLYLNFLLPRLPRLQDDDDADTNMGDNDNFDDGYTDQDEGRKKLSKKIQSLLPILLMLKMTMLPALAVMALVSGKAFLMSLLSLGVALVAASIHPHALSASKRHEIAASPEYPPDPVHSNYYYMM